MEDPFPSTPAKPTSLLHKNKTTICLTIFAVSLFSLGFVFFQRDDMNKLFFSASNETQQNSTESPLIRMAGKFSGFFVASTEQPNQYRLQLPEPLFERVIRVRTGRNGRKKYLVKFPNYSALYWISEKDADW